MDEARIRVARGAAHLDRVKPGWHERIDVGTLTLHDPCGCIVGQLCKGEYARGQTVLQISHPIRGGFDLPMSFGVPVREFFRPLQDAWIEAIAARLRPEFRDDAQNRDTAILGSNAAPPRKEDRSATFGVSQSARFHP
jgi:hypothetical protein